MRVSLSYDIAWRIDICYNATYCFKSRNTHTRNFIPLDNDTFALFTRNSRSRSVAISRCSKDRRIIPAYNVYTFLRPALIIPLSNPFDAHLIVGLIIELFNRYFDTTGTFRPTLWLFRNTIALIILLECTRGNIGTVYRYFTHTYTHRTHTRARAHVSLYLIIYLFHLRFGR